MGGGPQVARGLLHHRNVDTKVLGCICRRDAGPWPNRTNASKATLVENENFDF